VVFSNKKKCVNSKTLLNRLIDGAARNFSRIFLSVKSGVYNFPKLYFSCVKLIKKYLFKELPYLK